MRLFADLCPSLEELAETVAEVVDTMPLLVHPLRRTRGGEEAPRGSDRGGEKGEEKEGEGGEGGAREERREAKEGEGGAREEEREAEEGGTETGVAEARSSVQASLPGRLSVASVPGPGGVGEEGMPDGIMKLWHGRADTINGQGPL